MGPRFRIKVNDKGEILVATEDMPDGNWYVVGPAESLKIAHQVVAEQTGRQDRSVAL